MSTRKRAAWRRSYDWLRVVLPPWPLVLIFFAGLIAAELFAHAMLRSFTLEPEDAHRVTLEVHSIRNVWAVFGLVLFAIYRVAATHPYYRPVYTEWLKSTPWHPKIPLPLGPVTLLPQDAALVLAVALPLQHAARLNVYGYLALFLAPYLVMLLLPFRAAGLMGHCYGIAFGLAGVVTLQPNSFAGLGLLLVLYAIARQGMPASLQAALTPDTYPWDVIRSGLMLPQNTRDRPIAPQRLVGYPLLHLSPRRNLPSISIRESVLLAWLAAAWLYAVGSLFTDRHERIGFSAVMPMMLLLLAAGIRAAIYLVEYRSPINLLGRIATGQFFIWGYDRVWLSCLAVLLPEPVLFYLAASQPTAALYVGPVLLAAGMSMVFGLPPTLRDWTLTGHHRLAPIRQKHEFIEI